MITPSSRKQDVIALLDEFEKSKLPVTQFCKERNFPYHTFKYWHRKLRPKKAMVKTKEKFIPLNFPTTVANPVIAEIRYPSGISLFIYAIDNIEKLKSLL